MNLLKAAQRTLSFSFDGAREAVAAVAERVAARVRIGKLQLQMQDAEARLQQAHTVLGRQLFAARGSSEFSTDDLRPMHARILAEQQALRDLHEKLSAHY